ncbi:MAG: hypothetical protein KC464_09330 [Myxococcales bacterium]|nr:hypothetical protein [Myxococcales bacterium]
MTDSVEPQYPRRSVSLSRALVRGLGARVLGVLHGVASGGRAIGIWAELLGTASTGGMPSPRIAVLSRGLISIVALLLVGRLERAVELIWQAARGWV